VVALLGGLVGLCGRAGADVRFSVDLAAEGRAGHTLPVEMTVDEAAAPLELYMPTWTPGAYELRTWGKNVTLVDAADDAGRPLAVRRIGPSEFRVEGHGKGARVRVRYRVYAALLSDDASQVDARHGYLNGTSIFLAARGQERARQHVAIAARAGEAIATALEASGKELVAERYEALVDAPIEVGHFASAEVAAQGRTYRVVIDGAATVPRRLLDAVRALADAEAHAVGPAPYGRYLLIVHLSDAPGRMVALEHAASTSAIVPARSLEQRDAFDDLVYVVAHELFHAWNARLLRPIELEPYDFLRPRPSRALWITEGLTEYYAHRAMLRARQWSRGRYLDQVAEEAARALLAARRGLSVEEAAELAFSVPDDAVLDPDAYYAEGHLLALALDAELRTATAGARTLDHVMRALLTAAERAGGRLAVDTDRLANAVAEVAGHEVAERLRAWARAPFTLDGPNGPGAALERIGLELAREEGPAHTTAGFTAERDAIGLKVTRVNPFSGAGRAGLQPGDRIVKLDGHQPPAAQAAELAERAPGTVVGVDALRADRPLHLIVELDAVRPLACRWTERPVAPAVARLREALLSP
jgi:predicted metalloprotease with PDZ domain